MPPEWVAGGWAMECHNDWHASSWVFFFNLPKRTAELFVGQGQDSKCHCPTLGATIWPLIAYARDHRMCVHNHIHIHIHSHIYFLYNLFWFMCLSLLANLAMRQPPAISNGDSWGNSHKKPSPGSHKAKNQKEKNLPALWPQKSPCVPSHDLWRVICVRMRKLRHNLLLLLLQQKRHWQWLSSIPAASCWQMTHLPIGLTHWCLLLVVAKKSSVRVPKDIWVFKNFLAMYLAC